MARVYSVSSVHIHVIESKPAALIIFIAGAVTSSGWTRVRLSPWLYIAPPPDGIYDFDFTAAPPAGVALNVITPVATGTALPNPPKGLKGVRIHASANSVEALLSADARMDESGAKVNWSGDLPWPEVLRMEEGDGA